MAIPLLYPPVLLARRTRLLWHECDASTGCGREQLATGGGHVSTGIGDTGAGLFHVDKLLQLISHSCAPLGQDLQRQTTSRLMAKAEEKHDS